MLGVSDEFFSTGLFVKIIISEDKHAKNDKMCLFVYL